ncbi:MAG: hypothetical protein IPP52_08390 [Ignavibacteria bacterium]|nr:hypothetical protein [Ignavibacteria bacterium]
MRSIQLISGAYHSAELQSQIYNSGALNYNPANIQFQKTNDDAAVYLNLVTNLE